MPTSNTTTIVSKCTIYPSQKSHPPNTKTLTLKLSVSDLPMLSCHYIQKGVLFPSPPSHPPFDDPISTLKTSLSSALSHFPPLAGRLSTDTLNGHVYISCNDAGADFLHAKAKHLSTSQLLNPTNSNDVPESFKSFFAFDRTLISYSGHSKPLLAVQVTELADGIFIGCTINHSVVDGTSFWHFFNTFAAISSLKKISNPPCFTRDTVFDSPAVLRFPLGGPSVTFSLDEPLRERIFHFSRQAIQTLKSRANKCYNRNINGNSCPVSEVSSFQSLCALLWRSVTRARKSLSFSKTTTFRMAVNCRHRVDPKMDPYYFGNAIQSIPTTAHVGDLLSRDLGYISGLLHKNVVDHTDSKIRKRVAEWESEPRVFPLGNFDGASITMGSSPRFPMYENDFGWGKPVAVRSGRGNKFDGKISAFPGREGKGSVDLEVVLKPETMDGLETDGEFMEFVSVEV